MNHASGCQLGLEGWYRGRMNTATTVKLDAHADRLLLGAYGREAWQEDYRRLLEAAANPQSSLYGAGNPA